MISAESLARALGGKAHGRGWRAKCPAHDDRDPSLDITSNEDGRVLLKCRVGCENDAIIDALKKRGLWESHTSNNGNQTVRKPPLVSDTVKHPKLGAPTKRYDYYDTHSHLIGTIARWDQDDGKIIRPAVFDGTKWRWEGFDKPHPLYRLPEIAARNLDTVLVVEGEKTVEAARDLLDDYVVTTWPHGADATMQADWSPLKDRDVVLWPDADPAGEKAMRTIGAALREIGVSSVRLVKLPEGLPKGWDLADELPSDLRIRDLIVAARDLASERVEALGITTMEDILLAIHKPPRWAIPDLIPEGLTILAGKPKTGKSWLLLGGCIAVATGGYALGNIKVDAGPVLALLLEDTERRINLRVKSLLGDERPTGLQNLHVKTEWKRTDDGGLDDLRAWLSVNRNARLILIDTLQKIRGARKKDAGVYEDDYRAISDLKKLADEFGVPIVLIHHQNKAGNEDPLLSVSGTAGITGSADTIIVLEREANSTDGVLYVRGRDVNEDEIAIRFDPTTGRWSRLGKAEDWRISEERRAIVKLLMDEGAMHPREIASALGKKQVTMRSTLHRMAKDKEVTKGSDGKYHL